MIDDGPVAPLTAKQTIALRNSETVLDLPVDMIELLARVRREALRLGLPMEQALRQAFALYVGEAPELGLTQVLNSSLPGSRPIPQTPRAPLSL